jgi:uncharacterized protein YneF (UPF0154 family)
MEALEIICVVLFAMCGLGGGAYVYRQRKMRPTMKQSPSLDNLVIDDPQASS